jgi:hypothetical protein
LHDFAGRKLLLVFTQSGCGPCHDIAPELNRLYDKGEHQVLVVNNGDPESTRTWAAETKARFPVLAQEKFSVSKRYEAFATPFAFLIDEQGIVRSKGIAGNRQYLGYVVSGAGQQARCRIEGASHCIMNPLVRIGPFGTFHNLIGDNPCLRDSVSWPKQRQRIRHDASFGRLGAVPWVLRWQPPVSHVPGQCQAGALATNLSPPVSWR